MAQKRVGRARAAKALLLIDVINPFDFDGAAQLHRHALPAAKRILALREHADRHHWPVIYVNDNFGHWRSDFRAIVDHCSSNGVGGGAIPRMLAPREGDFFVLKPRHSGFYLTPLELLLQNLEIQTVVLTGFAANICVLYTAVDAHMRGIKIIVPPDAVAAEQPRLTQFALEEMKRGCHADIRPTASLLRQR
ncbi:MAG TPA: isochorismatase family cysteine hydrolase [Terriglobales bacterium]|nr:isochorismatase family cysteine hydrolase [Terriglobales bacterium]